MSTKTKTFKCKACGKTSEKIGVTSYARQVFNVASGDYTNTEVGETLHGFCLNCSAEIPAEQMTALTGLHLEPDYHSLLADVVKKAKVEVHTVKGYLDGIAHVSLVAVNKARTALGLKAL
jgi:hypothetical protein